MLLIYGLGGGGYLPPTIIFSEGYLPLSHMGGGGGYPPCLTRWAHPHANNESRESCNPGAGKSAPAGFGGQGSPRKCTIFRNNLKPEEMPALLLGNHGNGPGTKERVEHKIAGIT